MFVSGQKTLFKALLAAFEFIDELADDFKHQVLERIEDIPDEEPESMRAERQSCDSVRCVTKFAKYDVQVREYIASTKDMGGHFVRGWDRLIDKDLHKRINDKLAGFKNDLGFKTAPNHAQEFVSSLIPQPIKMMISR